MGIKSTKEKNIAFFWFVYTILCTVTFLMLSEFITNVLGIFQGMGYIGIFVMMTIESSFVPFPSEVAMIPAGALVERGEMSFFWALFAGTSGAYLGASMNYAIGYFLGAPVLKKLIAQYGKYIFLRMEHYETAEAFFQKNGGKTTFLGRFIPAVRQLISLPAGVFRMNFFIFSVFTILGAGLWNVFLLLIGYYASEQQDLILSYFKYIVIALLVVIIAIFGYKYYKKQKTL